MIAFELTVEDLADTRFAISPLQETVFSLWALCDPGRHALHLPWRRSVLGSLQALDTRLLLALVGESLALPDFLTPRPSEFSPTFEEQLSGVRATSLDLVRRDLLATHSGSQLPDILYEVTSREDGPVLRLLETICELLQRYWEIALMPVWSRMRLVLEADMTYRARRLATAGARGLFADLHPNVHWRNGILHIDQMIGQHRVAAAGRGFLLVPSLFAYKAIPPMSPEEPPWLAYPSRGIATLWAQVSPPDASALGSLLGTPRARLLRLLDDAMPTVEIARRLKVTPSAVSQHLQVLHKTSLVSRARDGRHVLYRRTRLGDELVGPGTAVVDAGDMGRHP